MRLIWDFVGFGFWDRCFDGSGLRRDLRWRGLRGVNQNGGRIRRTVVIAGLLEIVAEGALPGIVAEVAEVLIPG